MKRIYVFILLCCCVASLTTAAQVVLDNWRLGKIINESDLKLESVWRQKEAGKKRAITHLTGVLEASNQKIITFSYEISQKLGTMFIVGRSGSKMYEIYCESLPAHAVEWQRSSTQKISQKIAPDGCKIQNGTSSAYIVIRRQGEGAVLTQACYNYTPEAGEPMIVLNITITGKNGSYALSISEV